MLVVKFEEICNFFPTNCVILHPVKYSLNVRNWFLTMRLAEFVCLFVCFFISNIKFSKERHISSSCAYFFG
jgi:hypothetical protein